MTTVTADNHPIGWFGLTLEQLDDVGDLDSLTQSLDTPYFPVREGVPGVLIVRDGVSAEWLVGAGVPAIAISRDGVSAEFFFNEGAFAISSVIVGADSLTFEGAANDGGIPAVAIGRAGVAGEFLFDPPSRVFGAWEVLPTQGEQWAVVAASQDDWTPVAAGSETWTSL